MSELLLQEKLVAGQEFATADSSAALRNDNKGTGNDKDKSYSRSSAARRMTIPREQLAAEDFLLSACVGNLSGGFRWIG